MGVRPQSRVASSSQQRALARSVRSSSDEARFIGFFRFGAFPPAAIRGKFEVGDSFFWRVGLPGPLASSGGR